MEDRKKIDTMVCKLMLAVAKDVSKSHTADTKTKRDLYHVSALNTALGYVQALVDCGYMTDDEADETYHGVVDFIEGGSK